MRDFSSDSARADMYDLIADALDSFMYDWGDYVGDEDQLRLFINDAVDTYMNNFEW